VLCSSAVRRVSGVGEWFEIETTGGEFRARSVVIASGGLSIPKIGASGFGYDVARQFGLKVIEPRPALVPLVWKEADFAIYGGLAGVAADVSAEACGQRFREKMLFTHHGLSGPAILQASSYWRAGEPLEIDLLPGEDAAGAGALREARSQGARTELRAWLAQRLPQSLAGRWAELYAPSKPIAMLSDREIDEFVAGLREWRVVPARTAGYEKAEVTAGGVDTRELSSKTFEARKRPGLYFIGEVVDVTGWLGGFNFQWAWASGYSAGQYV
jgi:hypothetical protein